MSNFLTDGVVKTFDISVTTASNGYAPRALKRSGIALPLKGIITSNDVARGKPHPDPYSAGAALLGMDATKCQ